MPPKPPHPSPEEARGFTPGPWRDYDDGHGEDCDPEEPGKRWISIRTVEVAEDGSESAGEEIAVIVNRCGEPTEEQRMNAALLASAPALLAERDALRGALEKIAALSGMSWEADYNRAVAIARAALSAARGAE